jgi:hypothetical protein
MLIKTLLISAFTFSCFMGLQAAADQENSPVPVELSDKNEENASPLASCCGGKKKKGKHAIVACGGKKHKKHHTLACEDHQVKNETLLACKDCR